MLWAQFLAVTSFGFGLVGIKGCRGIVDYVYATGPVEPGVLNNVSGLKHMASTLFAINISFQVAAVAFLTSIG